MANGCPWTTTILELRQCIVYSCNQRALVTKVIGTQATVQCATLAVSALQSATVLVCEPTYVTLS